MPLIQTLQLLSEDNSLTTLLEAPETCAKVARQTQLAATLSGANVMLPDNIAWQIATPTAAFDTAPPELAQ